MKSYISKIFLGAAVVATLGLSSCVNDLDQLPTDPNTTTAANFQENPKEYLAGVLGKCYSSLAVSGQGGPNSGADISGLDGGTSQYTRAIFMMNEFTTDEVTWIWPDAGVFDLCTGTWGTSNANIFGTYSRLYTHIAVCNDFLRLTTPSSLETYEIAVDADLQANIDQFRLEARALRGLSYYYVIDLFGNAVWAWDDMAYGEVPAQTTREDLFNKVVADLEDVLASFPETTPVYGRIGKDAVEALLVKFYLNAEVYTGKAQYDKCFAHAENVIARHQGGGFQGSGLALDYLSVFCGNNDMFMPGGSLQAQNEILWGIPYHATYAQPYGGTNFLIAAGIKNQGDPTEIQAGNASTSDGFMSDTYYGLKNNWGCMHARKEFSQKFDFNNDKRAMLWLREDAGFRLENSNFTEFNDGYAVVKFTNVDCNADGTMPVWSDPITGLIRIGVQPVEYVDNFPDTDLPVIRLAEVYLNAAEAALRGGGDKSKGLAYANVVRERAGLAAWNTIEYNENNLLDERSRELYWENNRRTDLIRFNKYTGSSYVWAWKNNVPAGGAMPDHMKLFPIPSDVIATYGSSYQQNPGY